MVPEIQNTTWLESWYQVSHGKVTMLDARTGKPRTVIDIERAAKVTVEENSGYGPRVRKWKPMPDIARQLCDGSPPTAEDDLALPTLPPEADEAA